MRLLREARRKNNRYYVLLDFETVRVRVNVRGSCITINYVVTTHGYKISQYLNLDQKE